MSSYVENQNLEVACRIRDMREISGFSEMEMAEHTGLSVADYRRYEAGETDLPFSFIHKCALAFGIGITDLIEGRSARLTSYTVTRRGRGQTTAEEDGIHIFDLASQFRRKIAEPYWVKYEYSEALQNCPINLTTHSGQEFDYIIKGHLKIQVGTHIEELGEGDSIYYKSSTPHGMIAIDGEDCEFVAVVLPGEAEAETEHVGSIVHKRAEEPLVCAYFVKCEENDAGALQHIEFPNAERFNFGFDVVDALGEKYPDKLALLYVGNDFTEQRFTFADIKRASAQTANYFTSLGIKKGNKVMLVLKRHYQFWFSMVALHKMGAIAIPATNQLLEHDFRYRFEKAGVSAIVCTADGDVANQVELAASKCPGVKTKILVGGQREGWYDFDASYKLFTGRYERTEHTPCGRDPMFMLFTSGTTGYPKIVEHSYQYALGHFVTAKYWHCVERGGLHLTISDTGWGKALWGKLYGQWMNECAVFVYDFDRFDAHKILPMFAKYNITTFCAPPTMLRLMVKEDLTKYDLSSIHHMTTAGEALNPEVYKRFKEATGLEIMEGFGQTETTLLIANLLGDAPKPGSMGKPSPQYDVIIADQDGKEAPVGENGEICVRVSEKIPCGLMLRYCDDTDTAASWHDGLYHTGDVAWRDEDGYLWYVGRKDDVIKSSGYRIGPFEIESVIMELPYVLECGVSAAPDPVRGQVVKASIVLTKGTVGTEELKKEIQTYVKEHTAPYKYPRIVVFRDSLPKSISGKIQRNRL